MNDNNTRARIKALRAAAVGWTIHSDTAADDGHMMDAAQHLRRANECALRARQLEQTIKGDDQ